MAIGVSVKVVHFDSRRVKKICNALDFVSSADFFRTVPLKSYMDEIEEYASDQSKEASDASGKSYSRLTSQSMLEAYRAGWRVKRVTMGNRVMLQLGNVMNNFEKTAKWFRLWEFGSKAGTWVVQKTFTWFNRNPASEHFGFWTFVKGRTIRHAATEGQNVIDKTETFIRQVMLPQINVYIGDLITSRMERQ